MPFILLPLKNPFVFFDKKKKKKKKKKTRQICAAFKAKGKRHTHRTKTNVQSCGPRGVANCLPTTPPTRRRRESRAEERLVSAIDERRWKHRGRERYVCSREIGVRKITRDPLFFVVVFGISSSSTFFSREEVPSLARARVVRRVESADAKKNLPPNFLSF